MAFRPVSSPALSVCGLGAAEDGLKKKGKRTVSVHSSPSPDGNVDAGLESLMQCDVMLDERLWKMLPEEMLDIIIARLPLAAQCRFRCVCRKWKGIQPLVPPSPCMIMSRMGDRKASFYCESEKKWFSLPSYRHLPPGWTWEVVDVDAGLVLYQCYMNGWCRFCVCNPLKPFSSRLIVDPLDALGMRTRQPPKLKLLVDRANKTYKVVVKLDKLSLMAVYESPAARWHFFDTNPRLPSPRFFRWQNVIYAYSTEKEVPAEGFFRAFNMESKIWIRLRAEIPSEVSFPTNRFFLSDNNEVLLVLYSYRMRLRPYFSVWKLLDDGSSFMRHGSLLSREKWEKVMIGSERATVNLAGHRLVCASYAGEHVSFMFRDNKIKEDDARALKCVRYSFAAKTWSVIPCPQAWRECSELYSWEPCPHIDPSGS